MGLAETATHWGQHSQEEQGRRLWTWACGEAPAPCGNAGLTEGSGRARAGRPGARPRVSSGSPSRCPLHVRGEPWGFEVLEVATVSTPTT